MSIGVRGLVPNVVFFSYALWRGVGRWPGVHACVRPRPAGQQGAAEAVGGSLLAIISATTSVPT